MVLTRRVGKKRPFWRGFALSVATFTLYSVYWAYKAHVEVVKQYELEREGRDDGVVWLVLGLIINLLMFVYYWKFVSNVNYVRERMRLRAGITPAAFIGFLVGAGVVFFVVLMGGLAAMAVFAGSGAASEDAAIAILLGSYVLAVALAAPLVLYPYYRLQSDINETWDWFDANVSRLAEGPPPPAPPQEPPSPPATPQDPATPPPDRDPVWS